MEPYGPIQLYVIAFDDPNFTGRILPELRTIRERGVIRLIDALFVEKDEQGDFIVVQASDLTFEEARQFGRLLGKMISVGAEDESDETLPEEDEAGSGEAFGFTETDIEDVRDQLDPGAAALLLLVEHIWAKGLRDSIADAGGELVAQGMLTRRLVYLLGEELRVISEAVEAIETAEALKARAALEAADAIVSAKLAEETTATEVVEVLDTVEISDEELVDDEVAGVYAASGSGPVQADIPPAGDILSNTFQAQTALASLRALIDAGLLDETCAEDAIAALVAVDLIEEESIDQAGDIEGQAQIVEE